MRLRKWFRRSVAAVAVVAAAVSAPAVVTDAAGPGLIGASSPEGRAGATPADHWLTLVTGDRILVREAATGDRVVSTRLAKGREQLAFHQYTEHGDLIVVPSDAGPLVAAGIVDRRLFNVSKLIDAGYDDHSRKDIPLIVTQPTTSRASVRTLMSAAGAQVARELPSVAGEAVRANKDVVGEVWKAVRGKPGRRSLAGGISRLTLDGQVRATLDQSVPQIGAPAAWQAGHTGQGATVAVLDTGIDTTHPDLADAVAGSKDFSGSYTGATDLFGHGTHVASVITGSGAASGGRYAGVAPDARLLNGKVLNDYGFGYESAVIAGMEWAVTQGADVVNMSLGSSEPSDGNSVLDQAVNRLSAGSDTLFVVAAGNNGPYAGSISSPGAADSALTVGAVSKQDELAEFSSRGPRLADDAIKPDITAPGVDIVAALAAGSQIGTPIDGRYVRLSGTSMATPHVAGAAAILAGMRPQLGGEAIKAILMGTATPKDGVGVYEQGAGRVDVARATDQGVYTDQASINNGIARWPHEDDAPIEKAVTYRNVTDAAITLDLTVDVRDPSGAAAPAGMFTLDTAHIVVPAQGSASVTLVTDTRVAAPDGLYGGALVATGSDGRTLRTPVGVLREQESYDVTMTFLDHNGQPTARNWTLLWDIASPQWYQPYDASGTVVARLPKGRYVLSADIQTDADNDAGFLDTSVIEPTITVTGDLALTFDARDGKPFGAVTDRPATRRISTTVGYTRLTEWGGVEEWLTGWNLDHIRVRPSTTQAPSDQFEFAARSTLGEPDGSGFLKPYLYRIRSSTLGRVPAELTPQVRDADLAEVHTELAATGTSARMGMDDPSAVFTTPAKITEYYTPDTPWYGQWIQYSADSPEDGVAILGSSVTRTYQPGTPVAERWNVGVFGPAFPARWLGLGRRNNTLVADVPLFTDQAPDHWGNSMTDTSKITLYRDGEKVGEDVGTGGYFDVPQEPATYRLELEATRSVTDLSTSISSAWTFRSEYAPVADPQLPATPLPIMAVRFAPNLDDHNRAPAGGFSFPVYVQQQQWAQYGTLTGLTVQVSYDDGATWCPVPLTGDGLNRTAHVIHPAGHGFVSLKATATDSAGNSVEQTIIHAYAR
jgi:subtilisin family serine protease